MAGEPDSSKECPVCGSEVEIDSEYCPECGNDFQSNTKYTY